MRCSWKTACRSSGFGGLVLGVGLGLTCAGTALAQPVVFVDATATGANNGSTWTDAFTDLQPALDAAEASGGLIHEIWVANGTYKPSKRTNPDDPRSATFQLIDGVSLYGGFAGTEASVDERDIDANETILSGDFNGDDEPDFVNYDENAYHVVTAIDIEDSTIFDGLTVTGGHAPDPGYYSSYGGGMHLENAYPEIRNCTFTRNLSERPGGNTAWSGGGGAALFLYQQDTAPSPPPLKVSRSRFTDNSSAGDGAAVFIWASHAAGGVDFSECSFDRNVGLGAFSASEGSTHTFRACTFSDNASVRSGGAIATYSSGGELLINQCRFERNAARYGGAVNWDYGRSVTIHDSVFVDNSAKTGDGGAVQIFSTENVELIDSEFLGNSAGNGGGASLWRNGPTTLRRCKLLKNTANGEGGGLYTYGSVYLDECTLEKNSASSGGGMYTYYSSPTATNCTFDGNAANQGGGMFNYYSSSTVTHCIFSANRATSFGGAIHNFFSSPMVTDCTFSENKASNGGGMYNVYGFALGFPTVTNCTFSGNEASYGGVMYNESSSPILTNCAFSGNNASYGGGMYNSYSNLTMSNGTFQGNSAHLFGGAMYNVGGSPIVTNCVLWGNSPQEILNASSAITIRFSDVLGGLPVGAVDGGGNIDLDPMFVRPSDPGPDGTWDGVDDDYGDLRLQAESPCIDAGDPGFVAESGETDLEGHARVLCGRVDMGAYEFGIADYDCDRDVDMSDFSTWSACMGGPGAIPPSPDCSAFDFDGDGDIDLADFAQFSWVFSPGSP